MVGVETESAGLTHRIPEGRLRVIAAVRRGRERLAGKEEPAEVG